MCSTRCMSRNATPSTQTGYSPEPGCARCLGNAAAPFSPPAAPCPRWTPSPREPAFTRRGFPADSPRSLPWAGITPRDCQGAHAALQRSEDPSGLHARYCALGPRFGAHLPAGPLSPQGGRPCAPSCLGRSEPPPRPGCRAPTHRIAFGATRSCEDRRRRWGGRRPGTPRPTRSALPAAG